MSRELIVKPLGLVTRPNVYGQYPSGALSTATNLVMRAPGILESAPNTSTGKTFGSTNDVVHQVLPLPSTVMFSWVLGGVWKLYGNTTATLAPSDGLPDFSSSGRISAMVMRDRLITNTGQYGIYVIDPLNQTPPATLRRAGLKQPALSYNTFTTTNAQAIPSNSVAGYAGLWKRTYDDGYVLRSRPTPIVTVLNTNVSSINPLLQVTFFSFTGARVGDIIELYRTDIVTQAVCTTDPGTTLKKIMSTVLTSTDVSNGYALFTDATVPGQFNVTEGEALYTNPGQEGALAANRPPNHAACIANFKGFAFYGNVTQRPQLIFKVPGGISSTAFTGWNTAAFRKSGIGSRTIAGTVTNGSAVITGVSAADLVGIAIGQISTGDTPGFPNVSLATVTAINTGAGTITLSAVATGGAASATLTDVIELDGNSIDLALGIAGTTNQSTQTSITFLGYDLTTTENVYDTPPTTGSQKLITYLVEPPKIVSTVPMTVRASNGQNYDPPLTSFPTAATSINYQVYKNLLEWSKDSQPEHVPVTNQTFVGTGEIIALESTRDALWIFCTDGLYRLSGSGGQWRVDTMDTTLVLSSPRASCVLAEVVYAYTNRGLVRITDAGIEQLSERIIGDLLPGAEYTETTSIIVERNEAEDEVVIRLDATKVYVYSVRENAFTTVAIADVTAMAYVRYPLTGTATLAFGRSPSGFTPRYEIWNATNSFLAPTAQFQPVFADDPFAAKRWLSATYIFALNDAGSSISPLWNGNTVSGVAPNIAGGGRYVNESRVQLGVPRKFATGNSLSLGFILGSGSAAHRFFGASVRYKTIGEQQLKR